MDADPEVMRYIGDGSPSTRERTAAAPARAHVAWEERGYGLFAAEETATGELIGWVGLAVPTFLPEIMPAVEIGWRLRRRSWGRGYATEAAREVLAFAFDEAGLDRVVSICHVDHHASTRSWQNSVWRSTAPLASLPTGSRFKSCRCPERHSAPGPMTFLRGRSQAGPVARTTTTSMPALCGPPDSRVLRGDQRRPREATPSDGIRHDGYRPPGPAR
ncbi:GNAT family N-acetyltransferase [Streptomyces sp. Li-HN-5-11]|uniref:GNAT family N-acetyltransferase n=1 Tax=Streptomyces sp. Li-HN-5-11 TaxID=3075432 RepID=UPI0028ADBAF8|nr:GNAT family N-acetyltransferase [Streptomyces sp. Li-HN-5-11]WNM36805.1 GNAT family N-acetyltransferase [Streptomyces sp. Li-HN-5-11]